jgi:hypothetical protein
MILATKQPSYTTTIEPKNPKKFLIGCREKIEVAGR